ncbi:hypothetical protein FOE78_03280 [Microlunatus elymi]|uniref:Uncharacterized protein n=1 Tax=Microlunatus elymi TaxID=2596828 RepID=A0A516PV47_9ACTN|nr:hypothetical protein [Microlunatus elymi]QDP95064.1 hypothetical protein FOE78_03280 [Microlunatus elymi]
MISSGYALLTLFPTLLLLIIEIVALIIVLTSLRRTPRILAACGIGLLILTVLGQTLYTTMVPTIMVAIHADIAGIRMLSLGVYAVIAVIGAGGLLLIGLAIAARRNPRPVGAQR